MTNRPSDNWPSHSRIAIAAALLKGLTEGAFGTPDSSHGAEAKHGPVSARAGLLIGVGDGGRGFDFRGPQQQDVPRQVPHLQ